MANIQEILFSEADGSCAYCGIKDYRVLTVHHIIKQEPKDESYDNRIILCHNCHHMHHQNKGPSIQDLRDIKKRLIYKTLTQYGINALKEACRKGFVVASPYLVNHLIEMGYLKYSDTIMYDNDEIEGKTVDVIVRYKLTNDGNNLVQKWDF